MRLLGACSLQVLFEVLVTVWAKFCKIESRVLGVMQFGVLVQVLLWGAVWGDVSGAGVAVRTFISLVEVLLEVLGC